MGSIPHGSTINAQSFEPTATIAGAPVIPPASITPFVVGQPSNLVTFPSTNASDSATARLPQDLSKFMATGAITQKTLSDPNSVSDLLPKWHISAPAIFWKLSVGGKMLTLEL